MFERVRIGVIGVGNFGRLHALTLSGLAEAELVACVDLNAAKLEGIRRELPQVATYPQLEAALAGSAAEAWVIASSSASHVELAGQVLAAGRSVLVEKPVAESVEEALRLQTVAAGSPGRFMAGHILLFSTEFRRLLTEVRRRGRLTFINSVRHRPMATRELFPDETPLDLLMVHDLYLVYTLMDGVAPERFHAGMPRGRGGIELALAELQWPDGTLASCCASFLTPPGMPPDGFDRLEVFGQGWAGRMLANPRPVEMWDEKASWPMALEIHDDPRAPSGMLAEELRCFCRVVRGTDEVPVGARLGDAVELQKWMEALRRAAGG